MSKSSYLKKKGGNVVTKKMMKDRMEGVATLATALEATLMEWELWFRLIPQQKKNLTPEQFEFFINDGPIFTEFPSKIMQSIREQMPKFEPPTEEQKPAILDSTGLPAQKESKPILLDENGNPVIKP